MIQKQEEKETEGKRPGSEAKSIFLCRVSQESGVLHITQIRSQITYV